MARVPFGVRPGRRRVRRSIPHAPTSRRIRSENPEKDGGPALLGQRPEVLASLRTVARVESSESSNRLEGIVAPHARIERLVLQDTEPVGRSEQEVAGYRDALNLIHESAPSMPLSVAVVRQLHQVVYRYHPSDGGTWKATDNEIVERGADGSIARVRFRPAAAVRVDAAMDALVEGYRSAIASGVHDPLALVPLAILDFLCIHPFSDGNGRVSRLVTLQLFYHIDYQVGRYISLERVVEESKETCYEALERSSAGWHSGEHDAAPWLDYSWGVLLRAYEEFEDRVGHVSTGRGSKSEQVRSAVLASVGLFTLSDMERACPGVGRETIRKTLREMREEGLVAVEGRGRGARWRLLGS